MSTNYTTSNNRAASLQTPLGSARAAHLGLILHEIRQYRRIAVSILWTRMRIELLSSNSQRILMFCHFLSREGRLHHSLYEENN